MICTGDNGIIKTMICTGDNGIIKTMICTGDNGIAEKRNTNILSVLMCNL